MPRLPLPPDARGLMWKLGKNCPPLTPILSYWQADKRTLPLALIPLAHAAQWLTDR